MAAIATQTGGSLFDATTTSLHDHLQADPRIPVGVDRPERFLYSRRNIVGSRPGAWAGSRSTSSGSSAA
ncbi:MAG: hypothetical protein WKF78_11945 [Candidatus Limnocylindrales bacterium]